jgi:multidrug resistance protein, MATE family
MNMLRTTIPIILLQWLAVAASIIDSRFLAQSSHLDLAAMAISYRYYLLVLVFSAGVQMAMAVRMAAASLQKRSQVLANAGVFCLLLALPTAAAIYCCPLVLERVGVSHKLLILLTPYFHVLSVASIALWLSGLWRQALIAFSRQKLVIYLAVIYFIVHVACSYILVLGNLNFAALGLEGVAYSELISLTVVAVISGIVLSKNYKLFSRAGLQFEYFYRQWSRSWPVSLMWLSEMIAMLFIVMVIAKIGTQALAAYQIVAQLDLLLLMIPYAVSMACAIIFAQERNQTGREQHLKHALIIVLVPMLLASVVFLIAPKAVLNLFFNPRNISILPIAGKMLMITAIYHLFDGVRKVLIGCLRGVGDIHIPLLISFASFWMVGVCGAWLAFYIAPHSVLLIWLAFAAAMVTASVATITRYYMLNNRVECCDV